MARTTIEVECRVCGNVFEADRYHARYCSPRCRQRVSRAMRKFESETTEHAEFKARELIEARQLTEVGKRPR